MHCSRVCISFHTHGDFWKQTLQWMCSWTSKRAVLVQWISPLLLMGALNVQINCKCTTKCGDEMNLVYNLMCIIWSTRRCQLSIRLNATQCSPDVFGLHFQPICSSSNAIDSHSFVSKIGLKYVQLNWYMFYNNLEMVTIANQTIKSWDSDATQHWMLIPEINSNFGL